MGMVLYLRRAMTAEIEAVGPTEQEVVDFLFKDEIEDEEIIDFDKAWDALNFMLMDGNKESSSPFNFLLGQWESFGCNELFNEPVGKVVPVDAVTRFNAALNSLSDAALADRYDPAAMEKADIYMADMFVEEGAEALDYVMQGVPALRRFTEAAASQKQSVVIVIQ